MELINTIRPESTGQYVGTGIGVAAGGTVSALYFGRAVDTFVARKAKKEFEARMDDVWNSTTPWGKGGTIVPENFEKEVAESIKIHDNYVEKWLQAGSPSLKRLAGWALFGGAVVGGGTLAVMKLVSGGDDATKGAAQVQKKD